MAQVDAAPDPQVPRGEDVKPVARPDEVGVDHAPEEQRGCGVVDPAAVDEREGAVGDPHADARRIRIPKYEPADVDVGEAEEVGQVLAESGEVGLVEDEGFAADIRKRRHVVKDPVEGVEEDVAVLARPRIRLCSGRARGRQRRQRGARGKLLPPGTWHHGAALPGPR